MRETPSHPRHYARHARVIALAVLCCALAIAACGSSGNMSAGSRSSPLAAAAKFAACMRAHGVKNFPDPTLNAQGLRPTVHVDKHSPAFQTAQQACGSLLAAIAEATPRPPGAATQAGRVHPSARRAQLPRPTPWRRIQPPLDDQPTVACVHRRAERMRKALRSNRYCRNVATWGASGRLPLRPVAEPKEQSDRRLRCEPACRAFVIPEVAQGRLAGFCWWRIQQCCAAAASRLRSTFQRPAMSFRPGPSPSAYDFNRRKRNR